MGLMCWGLVPRWAKDLRVGNRHINARAETLPNRSAFKASFANRRCLVPATGFYEWSTVEGRKRPHWIHAADHGTLGFAGLWDRWRPAEGDPVYSFTIVTVPAGPDVTDVHDRMPAILDRAAWSVWLDRERAPAEAQALLRPLPGGHLDTREVSTWVNTPTNDDETCLEPAD
jgi:putative SOS response-associated peptidase YedK